MHTPANSSCQELTVVLPAKRVIWFGSLCTYSRSTYLVYSCCCAMLVDIVTPMSH
jgi:hypothetical protein